jgi:hypothetical protein
VSRLREWLLLNLPAGLLARPLEWFVAILCLVVGTTIVTGVATPPSIAALLPRSVTLAWGVLLLMGGLGLTCGLTSYRRAPGGWAIDRVACYRLGLRLLGLSSLVFTLAIVVIVGMDGIPAAAYTLSFALSCGVRLLTLESGK